MNLKEIRENIDTIDLQLLELLKQRFELALESRKFKNEVRDKKREDDIIENIVNNCESPLTPDFAERLYSLILEESKRIQKNN